jgi:long-chain acyl-CoA synthetase
MEKIWLQNYPPGVPAELELGPTETLVSSLENACRDYPDLPAFTNFGVTISFAELDALSARFAAYLQHDLGLFKGDRVALMMPNLLQYPVALYAVLRAGLVAVNVNPLYTARELQHQLEDSGARAIVVVANSAAVLAEAMPHTEVEHAIVTEIGDLFGFPRRQLTNFVVRYVKRLVKPFKLDNAIRFDEVLSPSQTMLRPETITSDDVAVLQYTGGTTGRSKGATLTHGNLIANVRQINTWFSGRIGKGVEIVLTPLPLYHVYALTCNCFAYVDLGARNILITDPRDTKGLIAEMARWKITSMTGVNTLYQSLVDHPDLDKVDFSHLKVVSAGGMAVMEFTARAWSERTGTAILEGYGLSETSPVLTSNLPNLESYTGTIGLPLPNTDISLRDDNNQEVGAGEPGELCAKGPQMMTGYWQNPAATAAAMTPDGYLRTGDIAMVDERGYFRIVDRKKDMILVSAFNVYPNEIENVVTLHPDVVECACIGVPDEESGEAVKIFVVLRPGAVLSSEDLRAHCRANLAAYKVPRLVEFRDELPKSNVGKILRRELRESSS